MLDCLQAVKMKRDVPLSVLKTLQQNLALADLAVHQSPEVSSYLLIVSSFACSFLFSLKCIFNVQYLY